MTVLSATRATAISLEQLTALQQAAATKENATYNPYSATKVGAAVLTAHGNVFVGSFIHNAAYSPAVDAERMAIFCALSSEGPSTQILALATTDDRPPNGASLETLREFGDEETVISWKHPQEAGQWEVHARKELMPFPAYPDKEFPVVLEKIPFTPVRCEVAADGAIEAMQRAYCPYSNYRVGAAVITERGQCFLGNNVENRNPTLGLCAERVAILNALASEGPTMRIHQVFVATKDGGSPCGPCRQMIKEFEPSAREVEIVQGGPAKPFETHTLSDLLPYGFGPKNLGIEP